MKITTKHITVSALLTALSLVYIWLMPTLDLGIWSFTPFSHIFIFIGTMVAAPVGVFTAIGTFFGFFFKGAPPFVLLRAGSHIFFTLALALMLRYGSLKKPVTVLVMGLIAAAVHSTFELLAVWVGILVAFPLPETYTTGYILGIVGGLTIVHSMVDYYAAFFLYRVLENAHMVPVRTVKPFLTFQRAERISDGAPPDA